jgi:hypothetical protein
MKQILSVLIISAILFGCSKSSTESTTYKLNGLVLDFDAKTVISGAKVYVNSFGIRDSAISDINGRVSFTLLKSDGLKFLSATKDNYLTPYYSIGIAPTGANTDRTDTVLLARPSFVNLTTHRTGTYLPTDSISISVNNIYTSSTASTGSTYKEILRDKADIADKYFLFSTLYQIPPTNTGGGIFIVVPGYQKVFFKRDIIRSGSVLSSSLDSTSLIQFGTKNFTLNY